MKKLNKVICLSLSAMMLAAAISGCGAKGTTDTADAVQSEINAAVKSLTLKIAAARLLGDVNGDGAVTTSDSVSVLAASAELTSLDADATASADVNGDGVADTLDAAVILQTAAEK